MQNAVRLHSAMVNGHAPAQKIVTNLRVFNAQRAGGGMVGVFSDEMKIRLTSPD
jgi:hypothetical protein